MLEGVFGRLEDVPDAHIVEYNRNYRHTKCPKCDESGPRSSPKRATTTRFLHVRRNFIRAPQG